LQKKLASMLLAQHANKTHHGFLEEI